MRVMLAIAGFDPSSGAGVTADLAVFAAHGCFGVSCVTALTVQSTLGVQSVHPVAPELLDQMLHCLRGDFTLAGVKVGMLGTAAHVEVVGSFLKTLPSNVPVVLDPVLRSTSGKSLLDVAGIELLHTRCLPLVGWVTPNIDELAVLTGATVDSHEAIEAAARVLQQEHPNLTVLATGGHLSTPDDLLLQPGCKGEWFRGERVNSSSTHGTGCALSSAVAVLLSSGMDGRSAVAAAKKYVARGIQQGPRVGGGRGPLDLWWPMRH